MIYNLGTGVGILETSFGPLHHQLNKQQIYISGDKILKFEHKRARIDQDTSCSVKCLFIMSMAPMSTKESKLLHSHRLLFESSLILNDLSDQISSIKSLADEENSRTTRKIGSQFKLVLQVIAIQDKTLKSGRDPTGINWTCWECQTNEPDHFSDEIELKNLEALIEGVKRKFAFKYWLEQWIVNNHETSLPKKKKPKQQSL
jgi:hypothetical protein